MRPFNPDGLVVIFRFRKLILVPDFSLNQYEVGSDNGCCLKASVTLGYPTSSVGRLNMDISMSHMPFEVQ